MKRLTLLIFLILFVITGSFAQKIAGFGGELSILSLKMNYRTWISRPTGLEIFGGIASELDDFQPDDLEVGVKYLHAFIYNRTGRSYFGIAGKWKWVNINTPDHRTNLPVPGILIGKEWYFKRNHLKGFAVELGCQFGTKKYNVSDRSGVINGDNTFDEFPVILNLRYSFYTKR